MNKRAYRQLEDKFISIGLCFPLFQLPYSASVDISDPITLEKPVLDIPWNGTVPTETETFSVFLLCSGKRSDEVLVELTINVTADPKFRVNEVTTIVLKRKKVCLEGNPGKNSRVQSEKQSEF